MKARSIGGRLAELRAALGLSQVAFAGTAGIPIETYKKYERNKMTPGADALGALARTGRVSTDWLSTGEGLKNPMAQIGLARDALVRFVERRSTIPSHKLAELMQIAFEKGLDAEGLEREMGGQYPMHGVGESIAPYTVTTLNLDLMALVIGEADSLLSAKAPLERAKLIAVAYDYMTAKRSIDREVLLEFLRQLAFVGETPVVAGRRRLPEPRSDESTVRQFKKRQTTKK